MAVTITKVTGADRTEGNKRVKVRDLAFSSTYPDGGESVTAADVGLRKIETVTFHGLAVATDTETANPVSYDYTNSKVLVFESAATGLPMLEKTDSEAHITGAAVRATFVGF